MNSGYYVLNYIIFIVTPDVRKKINENFEGSKEDLKKYNNKK